MDLKPYISNLNEEIEEFGRGTLLFKDYWDKPVYIVRDKKSKGLTLGIHKPKIEFKIDNLYLYRLEEVLNLFVSKGLPVGNKVFSKQGGKLVEVDGRVLSGGTLDGSVYYKRGHKTGTVQISIYDDFDANRSIVLNQKLASDLSTTISYYLESGELTAIEL